MPDERIEGITTEWEVDMQETKICLLESIERKLARVVEILEKRA